MKWRKLGRVYSPAGESGWDRTYAHLPTPVLLDDRHIRVYFAALDEQKRGRIGYVDVDGADPCRVRRVAAEPVLDLGEPGSFDDAGVNPSCLVAVAGRLRMYYIGWQRCQTVPYMLFAGLAEGDDGEAFRRRARVPILDRSPAEPFLRSATTIVREGDRYRAWYVSADGWTHVGDIPYPHYVVRHVESADGLTWPGSGSVCIGHDGPDEFGIGRPWVVRDGSLYRMW